MGDEDDEMPTTQDFTKERRLRIDNTLAETDYRFNNHAYPLY
jgi:hypothetical protein